MQPPSLQPLRKRRSLADGYRQGYCTRGYRLYSPKTKHLYFPSGSHWCSLRWRVGKSLESRCLSYKVRLPPVELEIPGVEIEKKRSRCCNEDPQIQVLLSPKEGRRNLWPVQNEKDIRSLHGVRVVEELSILNSFTGPTREASRSSNLTSFFPTARDPVQERTRQP